MERLFGLAIRGDQTAPAGYVAQITDNAFMKRLFGKVIVEKFLACEIDVTHVIDTSNVPIHGIATVILQGRNRPPVSNTVRCVLSIVLSLSDLMIRASAQYGNRLFSLPDLPGSENEYVSVADIPRQRLSGIHGHCRAAALRS